MNNLFYPPLFRRDSSKYCKPDGSFYVTYNCSFNYKNIAEDCLHRCVYCDAHVNECGGEPFSLDHFRPRNIFGDKFGGILNIHPFNLHLSCQKCNVLKSNDWQGCRDSQDGDTYINRKGYIDRFKSDVTDYLKVNDEGVVECVNSKGPGEYIIGKLLLNRNNRIYVRKCRQVKEKLKIIESRISKYENDIFYGFYNGSIEDAELIAKIDKLRGIRNKLRDLSF